MSPGGEESQGLLPPGSFVSSAWTGLISPNWADSGNLRPAILEHCLFAFPRGSLIWCTN